jgi:hypothetical protein
MVCGRERGGSMATWQELSTFLKSRYKIEREEENTIRLLFEVNNARTHTISVHNFAPMVTFSTPVGLVGEVDAAALLQGVIPFGVAQIGDVYAIMHTSWLATLDELEVEAPINILVKKADELEAKLTGKDRF